MNLLPLGLNIQGRRAVVVGGGPVAARRVAALLAAGAEVVVVAPFACEDIADAAAAARLTWLVRDYAAGDLEDAWLAFSATGSPQVDARVAADADAARVWCAKGGDSRNSRVWTPAVAEADGVQISVNAGGDPRRAVAIRNAVASQLDSGELPLRRHRRSGQPGSVALVGGGPGDAGLITTRGRRLLAQADVVVADRLGPRGLLDELAPEVQIIEVGKTPGHHPVPQHEINRILVEQALLGNRVVRLKGGDPYVLGRGGEEADHCRAHGVPVEIVPGVTSAVSVPAAAGIPVTHRGVAKSFSVLTGHEEIGTVPPGTDHTVVLLMGVSRLRDTAAALLAAGRPADCPVGIVEDGYGPGQRVTTGTLVTIAAKAEAVGVKSPAVIVVGDVVRLSPHYE
ncbi:uroporphyrinogen-III C-methyltransferase [Paenarthrobacter sp. DKR-5]|uniref:uroporphyrinogen-III C-methyltransferase n=1 Tax=Paenarthrobacter sp. DKR-5 TaxID=2835535 RepID=UPI001BDBD550|nr:uroporphyrinogen-III C-methyltransferase [Paenarthrobacter sp. DKR-5]MBT1001221.1 uroporphyrinogen-III C-methyltransferase [Paenarthrobacter sp. DKR-5]